MTENLESDASEKLSQLNGEINSRVTRLDKLGRKGEVEEAQVLLKEVEALERERDRNRSSKTKEGSKVRMTRAATYTYISMQKHLTMLNSR